MRLKRICERKGGIAFCNKGQIWMWGRKEKEKEKKQKQRRKGLLLETP